MVVLIAGASHTGKTALAQKLLERYGYPYLSMDLLKMGLIRSGYTDLTPMDDDKLTEYLWPVAREIVKTAIENGQNLIVEGCYIPFDWEKDFDEPYRRSIRYICLVMSERYIRERFDSIRAYANVRENRLDGGCCTLEAVLRDNRRTLEGCQGAGTEFLLIDGEYDADVEVQLRESAFPNPWREPPRSLRRPSGSG